ncbi:MAG: hypothetical protein ABI638_04295 [Ignavibacteriota bacterium]
MTLNQIKALGNLLQYYHSDLTYIRDFQRYKHGKIDTTEYLKKSKGSFKSFINEFRVARNIEKTKTHTLLNLTTDWITNKNSNDIDKFAALLKAKGITHGKVMTSLASKILFLNNPWKILPIDNLTKRAVGLKNNNYAEYLPLTKEFNKENKSDIDYCLASVEQHVNIIEAEFKKEIREIEKIRYNRFVDKLLWTIGQRP